MQQRKLSKKEKKIRKRKSLIRRFFKVIFTILSVYFVALASVGYIAYKYSGESANVPIVDSIFSAVTSKLPEVTNALIVGLDDAETRTDTIILASFNSSTNKFSIISIPRDTLVKIPQDRWKIMTSNFPALASNNSREIKINAINTYGGEKSGIQFLKSQLENMLGININYYFKFNLEGFKYIVDSIGGIEFDVPQKMYYSDPTQNLYINLKPGLQVLDGDKAEQLIRFRSYTSADLQRIQVQQDFIKAFLSTALSTSNIISNPSAYLNTIINYVETDFKISDSIKYLSVLKNFKTENFSSYTLPGTPQYISGASYYVTNDQEIEDFVFEVIQDNSISEENLSKEQSFSKSIQVLNGSYTSGLAAKAQKILKDAGYTVDSIGDYSDYKSKETKIYVKNKGQGLDLKEFFTDAKVIVKPTFLDQSGYDIIIVLGTQEELNQ